MKTRWLVVMIGLIVLLSTPCCVFADEPAETQTDSGLLWLVNRDNPVDEAYIPAHLTQRDGYLLRPEVNDAFGRMLDAMYADGVTGLYIQSAYRTYKYQQQLFNNKKIMLLGLGYDEETAIEMTSRSLAFPGASEHQIGLAIDVTLDGTLNKSFAYTDAGRWINENCHLYGFIVRYPEDKTQITRIIYEPWHLRYVGAPHAAFMQENDLCLEEYIDYVKTNRLYIYWDAEGAYYLIKYTDTPEPVPQARVIDQSADNAGDAGYIVTNKKIYPAVWLSDPDGGRLPKN